MHILSITNKKGKTRVKEEQEAEWLGFSVNKPEGREALQVPCNY